MKPLSFIVTSGNQVIVLKSSQFDVPYIVQILSRSNLASEIGKSYILFWEKFLVLTITSYIVLYAISFLPDLILGKVLSFKETISPLV